MEPLKCERMYRRGRKEAFSAPIWNCVEQYIYVFSSTMYESMCEGKSRSRTNLIGLKSPQVHRDSTMLMVYCAVWLCAKHCLLSYFPSITRPCKEWLIHNICTYVVHRIKYSFLMTIIVPSRHVIISSKPTYLAILKKHR